MALWLGPGHSRGRDEGVKYPRSVTGKVTVNGGLMQKGPTLMAVNLMYQYSQYIFISNSNRLLFEYTLYLYNIHSYCM